MRAAFYAIRRTRKGRTSLDDNTGIPYMYGMPADFEWDDAKAEVNLAKHRVSFDDAIEVFADPEVVVVASLRERDREERFKAVVALAFEFSLSFTPTGAGSVG